MSTTRDCGAYSPLPIQALLIIAVLVVSCLPQGRAVADIQNCPSPPAGTYAVFIDEPAYTSSAFRDRSDVLQFMNNLRWRLDQSFVGAGAGVPHASVRFQICQGRSPSLDGSDFGNPATIETLYNGAIVLEFWGSLDGQSHGDVITNPTAQINYLLVPVQFATDQNEIALSGILGLAYPATHVPPSKNFTELLTRSQNIDALLDGALGYKALREHKFEMAHDSLCQAGLLLGQIEPSLTTARQKSDTEALRKFVLESAGRAITGAVRDPHYTGTLKIQNPATPCPGATGSSGGSP